MAKKTNKMKLADANERARRQRKKTRIAAFLGALTATVAPDMSPSIKEQLETEYFDGKATGDLLAGAALTYATMKSKGSFGDYAAGAGGALLGRGTSRLLS